VRRLLATAAFLFSFSWGSAAAAFDTSLLVPQPNVVKNLGCGERVYARSLRVRPGFDPGARELIDERWSALGIPALSSGASVDIAVRLTGGEREHYHLTVPCRGPISIRASGVEGVFDATMTLAQLARPLHGAYAIPPVEIDDAPALRWRIVSDDVSRGPLPAMPYFKERIRGLAALKINGYSIYMEDVFGNSITPRQLRELHDYAARFHVALIPEQQTLAHMHGTLSREETGALSSPPHGWLLSPANPGTYAYLTPLLREIASAAGNVPFFHLGSDEPIDLNGPDAAKIFAAHVNRVESIIRPFGARPMIWDDAVQKNPEILRMIRKDTVIVDFHYGREGTFAPYIRRVAGFQQMVSPGANNWNEIYPRIDLALDNIGRFVADGRRAHVLGMFMTVWHDDGESLYEATWYPLAFAAASAWQDRDVDRARFPSAFAWAFFASKDSRWARSMDRLREIGDLLDAEGDPDDYLFWADPFDPRIGDRVRGAVNIVKVRLDAESVLDALRGSTPPMHANAARVLALAARRYDALGRRYEIGVEAKQYYDGARGHLSDPDDSLVYRGLNLAKYVCWELRDDLLAIEPLYKAAWNYESRPDGLGAVLTRFHLNEQAAQSDADRLNEAEREDYARQRTLPAFEDALRRSR
jgi:hexosaminidase